MKDEIWEKQSQTVIFLILFNLKTSFAHNSRYQFETFQSLTSCFDFWFYAKTGSLNIVTIKHLFPSGYSKNSSSSPKWNFHSPPKVFWKHSFSLCAFPSLKYCFEIFYYLSKFIPFRDIRTVSNWNFFRSRPRNFFLRPFEQVNKN